MKLVAAMNTRNELGRYLQLTIAGLLEFCDEVRVQDDGSDDLTPDYLESLDRVVVRRREGNLWRRDEGQLHAELLEHALEGHPTHILAIDADEYVVDGEYVRDVLAAHPNEIAFTLRMVELWELEPALARWDGGWRPHPVGILYRAPSRSEAGVGSWQIEGRRLASPRVPRCIVRRVRRRLALPVGTDVLHLGWSNPAERVARHRRYVELDDGRYHASRHLDSILDRDGRCDLRRYADLPPAIAELARATT